MLRHPCIRVSSRKSYGQQYRTSMRGAFDERGSLGASCIDREPSGLTLPPTADPALRSTTKSDFTSSGSRIPHAVSYPRLDWRELSVSRSNSAFSASGRHRMSRSDDSLKMTGVHSGGHDSLSSGGLHFAFACTRGVHLRCRTFL